MGKAVSKQQPVQLRHGDDGVRIVELQRDVLRQQAQIAAVPAHEATQHILHGGTGQQILLAQAQAASGLGRVVGIQHAAQIRGAHRRARGRAVLPAAEGRKVEGRQRLRLPQAQRADVPPAIADHRHIVRHGAHRALRIGDGHRLVGAAHRPRIALGQPVVRLLDLRAVREGLCEQPVPVAQAVAVERQPQRGRAVQIARGKATQPAVAEAGIRQRAQLLCRPAVMRERLVDRPGKAGVPQIFERLLSDEVFRRQIIGAPSLGVPGARALPRRGDVRKRQLRHGARERRRVQRIKRAAARRTGEQPQLPFDLRHPDRSFLIRTIDRQGRRR